MTSVLRGRPLASPEGEVAETRPGRGGVGRIAGAYWGAAIALLAFGISVATGLIGINFGYHWDEALQFDLVTRSIHARTLLPHIYLYPSITYELSMLGVGEKVLTRFGSPHSITAAEFSTRVRSVFLIVSCLGGLALYFAGRRRFGEVGAAFAAALYFAVVDSRTRAGSLLMPFSRRPRRSSFSRFSSLGRPSARACGSMFRPRPRPWRLR